MANVMTTRLVWGFSKSWNSQIFPKPPELPGALGTRAARASGTSGPRETDARTWFWQHWGGLTWATQVEHMGGQNETSMRPQVLVHVSFYLDSILGTYV